MTLPVYYAKDICKSPAQAEAAQTLLIVLLVRRLMRSESLSYWERRWKRAPASMYQSTVRMRSLLVARKNGRSSLDGYTPDPASLLELEQQADVYGPILDDIEQDACLTLDDGRVEALVRQMFNDEMHGLFAYRQRKPSKRAAKRGPGRPKGAKNKPKVPQRDEAGWLMPDGTRIPG